MPIARLTQGSTFGPDEIRLMTDAFEAACRASGLADPNEPRRDVVAKRIIEAAQGGERDPGRLRQVGIRAAQEK